MGSKAAFAQPIERYVAPNPSGKLVYEASANGDRIPDFSHCGYQGGGVVIPEVPVRVVVEPIDGDNTARIQAAIDYVSQLPRDGYGFRGAVLLMAGRHNVADSLKLSTSGVVLRGQGNRADQTLLVATGTDRRSLIRVAGKNDFELHDKTPRKVASDYVPVGATKLRLDRTDGLKPGDTVVVHRPSTMEWITSLGMHIIGPEKTGFKWRPGEIDLRWDRVVKNVAGDTIELDAPLTTALDQKFGGGTVTKYTWPGRIRHVGVENVRCESEFELDNPLDEQHAWEAVTLENVENAWVRQITAGHFAGSVVNVLDTCKHVTVEDCRSLAPVSEIAGYRRHTFFTAGQLTLFQRCRAEAGRHDFAVGYLAAGPNAFVECQATRAHGFSGPIGSWASGVLYDGVDLDGGGLSLDNLEIDNQGVGWAAANCVLWQCTAPVITCRTPPGANNWAIGCWGQFVGNGSWRSLNEFVKPESLYRGQLVERLGEQAADKIQRHKIPIVAGGAKTIDDLPPQFLAKYAEKPPPATKPIAIENGWLVCDGRWLTGGRMGTTWWRGSVSPSRVKQFGAGVTRFVPGRIGQGYTDDLDELTDSMLANHKASLEHHWGLWYDRRRDDHQMIRRADANVWPPFLEQPWARSGKQTAWDGLSKYDLMKFNPWYFNRLDQFAALCDQKGLILLHQGYFQHNILEAGAHWADFPWRSANCLHATGFPEPPPYVNKKRIFMAEEFYDVDHPLRRELHQKYICHYLDTLADHANVIYLTGGEFTGPLHFVQFWLDTIAQWQAETGKRVFIGLSCTKDVQDAILADEKRSPLISVIDLRQWWYTADGGLYAPGGGENLAPRQHLRQWKGSKKRSNAQTARQIREYRERYPEKAVICSFDGADPWAVLCGGGSLPDLPATTDPRLLAALPRMKPIEQRELTESRFALADEGRDYLVYSTAGTTIRLDLSNAAGEFAVHWIDLTTGVSTSNTQNVLGGSLIEFSKPGNGAKVLWLTRAK